jgi:hypothetical protein
VYANSSSVSRVVLVRTLGDRQLAEVVEVAAGPQRRLHAVVQAQLIRDRDDKHRSTLRMATCVRVLSVDEVRDDPEQLIAGEWLHLARQHMLRRPQELVPERRWLVSGDVAPEL